MSTRPSRETAYRVFAAEFDDATLSYAESDEERAPNYVVTPTGARVNRLFLVGVLTEIESVNEEQLRARVVDPTGAFVVYAGQYQPEALSFLERVEVPTFVAVTGKARTFQPEDSTRVYTSVRPETLSEVDAATRDRWTVRTAEQTTERVATMVDARERNERDDALGEALAEEGVEPGLAAGIPLALDHYGTTPAYLDAVRETALDAARVVADEREEVSRLSAAPDEGRSDAGGDAVDASATTSAEASDSADLDDATADGETETATETGTEQAVETTNTPETESAADTSADATADPVTSAVEADSNDDSTDVAVDSTDGEPVADEGGRADRTNGEGSVGDGEPSADDTEFDPEEFELDDAERERIEEEYGTDFESAAEVDGPGEAGIETPEAPEPDDAEPAAADADVDVDAGATEETEPTPEPPETGTDDAAATETDVETADEATTEKTAGGETDEAESETETPDGTDESADEDSEPAADNPEEAVVEAMRALDDGDGAARGEVIERVVENGLSREAAEEGIQSALMSGECYEPDDDTLKPI